MREDIIAKKSCAEFLQSPLLNDLRWMRAVGDTIFTAGAEHLASPGSDPGLRPVAPDANRVDVAQAR